MPPQRNLVWITGSKNEKGISALLDIARSVLFDPRRIAVTRRYLRRNGKGLGCLFGWK